MGRAEPVRPERRRQEERSAATRERLLDATIDCLIEVGYAATTTTIIARRAGVSRGAQLHHYPTKAELVAAALAHLARRFGTDLTEEAGRLRTDPDRVGRAVDALWEGYGDTLFHAWLELWVAARTDTELRAILAPLERRLRQGVERQLAELFTDLTGDSERSARLLGVTLYLLQGVALEHTLTTGDRSQAAQHVQTAINVWKEILVEQLGSRP